jgi:hypothetical protein
VFDDCHQSSAGSDSTPTPHRALEQRRTCWFHEVRVSAEGGVSCEGLHEQHAQHAPLTTLMALEETIAQRKREMAHQTGVCARPGFV